MIITNKISIESLRNSEAALFGGLSVTTIISLIIGMVGISILELLMDHVKHSRGS